MPDQSRASSKTEPRQRTARAVADCLVAEVRSGVIAAGTTLPAERELAERFETSRPTIREALSEMQYRGYLVAGGGRRPHAAQPSLETVLEGAAGHIREILGDAETGAHLEQMRQFIEMGAAREAALRADRLHLARLSEALKANGAAIGTSGFAATDIGFHRALVGVVGNPIMLQLHDMFVSTLLATRPAMDDPVRHDRVAHEEHQAIYEAVLAGDAAVAVEVMDRHLTRSYRARLGAAAAIQPPT